MGTSEDGSVKDFEGVFFSDANCWASGGNLEQELGSGMGKGRSIGHHEPQRGLVVLTLNISQVRAISNKWVRGRRHRGHRGHRVEVLGRLSFTGCYTFSAGRIWFLWFRTWR